MKISRIKIENFRSIVEAEFICSDFNIFVGQNNVGKTNLFEALEWFYSGTSTRQNINDLRHNRNSNNEILVEVEFSDAQHGAENMRNETNRTKMLTVLGGHDVITVRRTSVEGKRVIEIDGAEVERLPTGFDKAFNDFLPKFEYVHTKQYFDEVAKFAKKTPIGIMLSGVLENILDENRQYREFKEKFDALFDSEDSEVRTEFNSLGESVRIHLEKQFTECTSVSFEVKSPEFEDLLKNFETVVNDGIETYAHEKGDGMQRALMLAIIQAFAEHRKARDDAGKSFLFFIDEAELHLHPTAQRKLKEVLHELCADLDKVFINTHSSVLVADEHDSQSVFRVEKNDGQTSFEAVEELDKPYVIYELLGGSPADLKIFQPLQNSLFEERLIVLCDQPTERAKPGFDEFERSHRQYFDRSQIKVLPVGSLEEYYPDHHDWKRTSQQVSDMTGKQKRSLAKRVGDEIEQHQFETEMAVLFESLTDAWQQAF